MDSSKQKTKSPEPETLDTKLCDKIALPGGDVMLRRVGAPDGITSHFGKVKLGRTYCLSAKRAARVMDEMPTEFEPVFQVHRTMIEAASKKAETKAADKK